MLKSWRFHAVVAVILGTLALVGVGCWTSDDEETPSIETTHVNEAVTAGEDATTNQVAHSSEAASDGEDAPTSQAAHSSEAAPDVGDAPSNQAVHSNEAASAGEDAPPNGTELADSVNVSPRSDSPAPLRLRIFEASAIVRASLISSAAGAVRYSEALGLDLDGEPLTSFNVIFDKLVPVPCVFDMYKKYVSLMYDPIRRTYEDMPALKYKVELNESERTHLKEIASRGETSARKVKRALVLLKADEGLIDRDIASGLLISTSTVGRVRTRFVKEGLDSALNERTRPGQKRKLDGRQEAHLIAVACSDAPEGHTDWTLQLLADKAVAMGFAESISLETVRQILKKRELYT